MFVEVIWSWTLVLLCVFGGGFFIILQLVESYASKRQLFLEVDFFHHLSVSFTYIKLKLINMYNQDIPDFFNHDIITGWLNNWEQ